MTIYQLSNNISANASIHNIPQKKIIDLNAWEFTGYAHVYSQTQNTSKGNKSMFKK